MLAAAGSKCKTRLTIRGIMYCCPNCLRNITSTDNKSSFFMGIIPFSRSFNALQRYGYYYPATTRYVKSIPVGVFWIWPLFAAFSSSVENHQLVARQSSGFEETTDNILNQILSAKENSPASVEEVCRAYIEKLCCTGNLSAACKLLQFLCDRHISVTSHACNALLKAAGEENEYDILCQSFKYLLASCKSISSSSYLIFAKAFMKKDDGVLLLKFVRDLSALILPRKTTALNRIIYAFAECGQPDKAFLIFDQMKSLGCKPDLVTYNTILGILGRHGQINEMLDVFSSLKEAQHSPDTVSYNTLLNSLRKVGRLDLCSVIFKEMCENGVEPDLRTYTTLIESFGRSGNIEESLTIFYEMKRKGIHLSIYIYRSLINNLKKNGKLELAMALLEEMNAHLPNLIGPKDFKRRRR